MTTFSNPTYVLCTCDNDLQDYGRFQWREKGYVEASDWNPKPVCGGGLHGLLMGKGAANLLNWYRDDIWQVVEVQKETIVWIGNDQVKFPYGNVVYSGNRKGATDLIISLGANPKDVPGSYQIGGDNAKLIGGERSTLTGGEGSTVQGGNFSTLRGGNFSTLRGGEGSTLTGGYGSTLQGGKGSTLTGGVGSTLTGGYDSTLTGGYSSTLQAGNASTLQGGRQSNLTGGEWSKFKAGEESCFIGSYWKNNRKRVIKVCVGKDGIKADTWYRFENGVFTKFVNN